LIEYNGNERQTRRKGIYMKNNKNNNKVLKFSIRKLSFGAAPVIIGALIFGSFVPTDVHAAETKNTNVKFTYLEKNK